MNINNRFHSKSMQQGAMVMWSFGMLTCLLLSTSAQPADCFCIEDADDAIWYDCEEFHKGPTRKVIHCRPKPGMARQLIPDGTSLSVLKDGEGACSQCPVDKRPRSTAEIPRGDGNRLSPAKKDEQDTPVTRPRNDADRPETDHER